MLKKEYSKSKPVCKVTFSLPQEAIQNATTVKVLGDFNAWSWEKGAVMKLSGGEFKASLELETGRHYEFRYYVDQNYWITEPAADGYTPTPFGTHNAIVAIEPFVASAAPAKKAAAPKKAAEPAKAAAPKKAAAPAKPAVAKKAAAPKKEEAPKAKTTAAKPAKSDKTKGSKKA